MMFHSNGAMTLSKLLQTRKPQGYIALRFHTLSLLYAHMCKSHVLLNMWYSITTLGYHFGTTAFIVDECRPGLGYHKTGYHGNHLSIQFNRKLILVQRENPWKLIVSKGFVAETVGFEPTCPCGQLDFESFGVKNR